MEAFSLRPWFVLFSQSMFYKQLCVYMETFALLPCSRCKECIVLPGMKEPLIAHRRVAQQVNPNDKWEWTVYIDSSDEEYIICFTSTSFHLTKIYLSLKYKDSKTDICTIFFRNFYFIFNLQLMSHNDI